MTAAIEEIPAGAPVDLDGLVRGARPVVIRGLVADWPIVAAARASDWTFAEQLAGFDNGTPVDALMMPPEAEGVVGYNADLSGFNYRHHRVPLTKGLKQLLLYARQERPNGLAIQSAALAACAPGFLERHALPLLPPSVQPRLWVGNRVTTPAHFDEFHNVACVVCGARRFTLFPPEQVRNLYIGPLDFAPTGAAISVARLDRPDDPRFPRLREALAHAQAAELEPGDAIYIPPLWWHHVASLKRLNALVNYWWKPVAAPGTAPMTLLGCLLHAILGFRSLPPAERAAWRALLDHYVFGEEDPAAHIPEARRGVLGPLTPEQVEALRAKIQRYL